MKNSILSQQSYKDLVSLRKHFNNIYGSKVRSMFEESDKELLRIISDLDDIILEKVKRDLGTPVNNSNNISN